MSKEQSQRLKGQGIGFGKGGGSGMVGAGGVEYGVWRAQKEISREEVRAEWYVNGTEGRSEEMKSGGSMHAAREPCIVVRGAAAAHCLMYS